MIKSKLACAIKLGIMCGLVVTSSVAVSQDAELAADAGAEKLEKISITGLRGAPRSVNDSPVPIDVLSEEDLVSVAFSDMNDVLKTLVPSYTLSRQPISDGGTFVRPASLRGLPTDKTLVLVNSKRRHRASVVQIGGSGTQGPDISTIPTVAIRSVEVLRDGAAAQYGSDAIAGVINFKLKNNSEGGSATVEYGQYYEGDGQQVTLAANKGFELGSAGFLSISGEITDSESTIRAEQYCEPWFCLDTSNPVYDPTAGYNESLTDEYLNAAAQAGEVVQPWGQPNSSGTRVFFNLGYELSDEASFYSFGNYSQSEGDGNFFYRYPGNGTIEDLRLEDGSVYSPLEKFPGGFAPRFFGEVTDYSFVAGLEGDLSSGWSYDVSGRYGYSEISYTLRNTINPSLGRLSPTEFKPGDLANEEIQFQADAIYEFDAGFDSDVSMLIGVSYFDESYEVIEGETSSYEAGPHALSDPFNFCDGDSATTAGLAVIATGSTLDCANSSDPVYRVVGVGSNGFPGYSPAFSDTYKRDSYAVYIDFSADVTSDLFLQTALRYEDYSDFDSELVGKIAGRYALSDEIGIRASFGTGFRAPTPGQQGTTNVSTRLPNGLPVATGLFPASSSVSQALGAEALRPETSVNYTFGMTASVERFNVTLDYYRILLEDRVNAISTLAVSTDETKTDGSFENYVALRDAGVAGAESIGGVFYFQNAFDSITEGIDLVISYSMTSDFGDTALMLSGNYNSSKFDSDPSAFLNAEAQYDFENGRSKTRGVFSIKQAFDDLTLTARFNYYGSYDNANGSPVNEIQTFGSEILTDVEAAYQLSERLSLNFGARNIFDEYPDVSTISGDTCCGRIYLSGSEVDWQGGFYYAKVNYVF